MTFAITSRARTVRTPVRRWGRAGDFSEVAAFLADPRIEFHTGNEVVVDGGYTAMGPERADPAIPLLME